MDRNPITAPVKSPWGGYDIYVLPDSDDEARAAGWPDNIIDAVTPDRMAHSGNKMYVRHTTWERVRAEFDQLGKMH